MGLYVASHYKNTPNDLQLLSDAPAHILAEGGPGGGERVTDMTTLCKRHFGCLRYLYFWLWLQLASFPLLQVG